MHRLLLGLIALIFTLAASRPAEALQLKWFDGVFTSIDNDMLSCPPFSVVQTRVQAYAGFSYMPPDKTPAIGEVFYTHLIISHPGNPCGGSVIGLELLLPQGMQPAISAGNPVFCFARVPNGPRLINLANDSGYGCPQQLPQGLEGYAIRAPLNTAEGGAWRSFQGVWLEFLIPVTATAPQAGNNLIKFRINPAIAEVGYATVPALVTGDIIFRTANEDNVLSLDICSLTPIAQGC